jgi:hypothetical protein
LAREVALARGIEIVETWTSAIRKGRFQVRQNDVAVGTIPFVHERLRASGVEPPPPNDYPEAVREFLCRDVRRTTLQDARDRMTGGGLFVKPAVRFKRFSGFVTSYRYDHRFNGAGARTEVWVSTPVHFISEWRIYAVAADVLAISPVPGNPSGAQQADRGVIGEIAARLYRMPDGFDGVCFDVGVLADGRTALVEVNEGYGFGAYDGCSPTAVWAINEARQRQILASATPAGKPRPSCSGATMV